MTDNVAPIPTYVYYGELKRIKDGDTALIFVDLGFGASVTITIRLNDVDTPEKTGPTKAAGLAAMAFSENLLKGKKLVVKSYKDHRSFERWVADVWLESGASWGDLVVESGHGVRVLKGLKK